MRPCGFLLLRCGSVKHLELCLVPFLSVMRQLIRIRDARRLSCLNIFPLTVNNRLLETLLQLTVQNVTTRGFCQLSQLKCNNCRNECSAGRGNAPVTRPEEDAQTVHLHIHMQAGGPVAHRYFNTDSSSAQHATPYRTEALGCWRCCVRPGAFCSPC